MAFPKSFLADLKDRADIVEVIGERVSLTAAGANYKGLCPFHAEKTPSFMVNPAKHMYHCFGCGAGGSVVDFVMAFERLEFPQAVRALAERVGLAVPGDEGRPQDEGALRALQVAQAFYHDKLLSGPGAEAARAYLRGRQVDEDTWRAFGLGFAPDDWQALTSHGQRQRLALEDLLAAGLVRRGSNGRPFDFLRNRVTFPILDPRLKPIAFGGRIFSGEQDVAKYMNTPETAYYRKSHVLFGLAQGQQALRAARQAILVEGYLDVIRLHRHGFTHAVAACGTALTAEHLKLLKRYTDRVLLVFDGDAAGIKAALRSAPLFLNGSMEARVVVLPDGLDPDDYLVRDGTEAFQRRVEQAAPLLEFLVITTWQQNGRTPQGKERTMAALLPVLTALRTDAVRDLTVRHLADLLEIRAETIQGLLETGRRNREAAASAPGAAQAQTLVQAAGLLRKELRHQRMALSLLLKQRPLLTQARAMLRPEEFSDPDLRALFEQLLSLSDEEFGQVDLDQLAGGQPRLGAVLRGLLVQEDLHARTVTDAGRELLNRVAHIKEAEKERLYQHLKRAIGTPEEELAARRYLHLRNELRGMLGTALGNLPKPESPVTLEPAAS